MYIKHDWLKNIIEVNWLPARHLFKQLTELRKYVVYSCYETNN